MLEQVKPSIQPETVDDELSMDSLLSMIYRALDEKKAERIVILDMTTQVDYLDYLVICTGQTEIHCRALIDHLAGELGRYDIIPDGLHGYAYGDWIVADYGVLVVHAFLSKTRDFYRLEELWAGGREVELK
jgi:ribosome-associated protein